jgi:hypothetical protein
MCAGNGKKWQENAWKMFISLQNCCTQTMIKTGDFGALGVLILLRKGVTDPFP